MKEQESKPKPEPIKLEALTLQDALDMDDDLLRTYGLKRSETGTITDMQGWWVRLPDKDSQLKGDNRKIYHD